MLQIVCIRCQSKMEHKTQGKCKPADTSFSAFYTTHTRKRFLLSSKVGSCTCSVNHSDLTHLHNIPCMFSWARVMFAPSLCPQPTLSMENAGAHMHISDFVFIFETEQKSSLLGIIPICKKFSPPIAEKSLQSQSLQPYLNENRHIHVCIYAKGYIYIHVLPPLH